MKHISVLISMVLTVSAGAASADTMLSKSEQNFIKRAAIGDMAEMAAGQLAVQKAANPDLKQFAQTLVADHTSENVRLQQIATSKGVALPDTARKIDTETNALSKLSGPKLDQRYAKMQLKDDAVMIKFFQKEAASGKDADLRKFASDTLPKLQAHSDKATQLASAVGVTVTPPQAH